MNRRIVRNGLLSLGLCALAILMPAHESEAQTCSPACQQCVDGLNAWGANVCMPQCLGLGLGAQCPGICQQAVNNYIAQYCLPL